MYSKPKSYASSRRSVAAEQRCATGDIRIVGSVQGVVLQVSRDGHHTDEGAARHNGSYQRTVAQCLVQMAGRVHLYI